MEAWSSSLTCRQPGINGAEGLTVRCLPEFTVTADRMVSRSVAQRASRILTHRGRFQDSRLRGG